ncbi:MAG: exodeoxyribonuclease VII small subunit [Lachnospiraceae bacterium]|nr:exodeoxyribonuclease VII small subunit [Lachnospiraceae bacterium]
MADEFVLEEAFESLDDIIERLEDPEISLEDSFTEYQKGMELLKRCNEAVDTVEKKIRVLEEGSGDDEL